MNLIEMKKILQKKDQERNKFLGQKELLMKGLKDLCFNSVEEAKKAGEALQRQVTKMEKHYKNGIKKFKDEYGHLLT